MTPVPPAPTTRSEVPAEIFSVGQVLPSGRVADRAFLEAVVANWSQYQAKGDPRFPKPPAYIVPAASIALGHEDNSSIAQAYADRTDLPAVGWPDQVTTDGQKLYAYFTGVPVGLARWVNAKAWRKCSSEFYEDYEGFGPCLRRVSLVGAEIPACKDLADLPVMVFDPEAEKAHNPLAFTESLATFARAHRGRSFQLRIGPASFVTFTEETPTRPLPMTPQQTALVAALQSAGLDISMLDGQKLDAIMAACQPVPAPPPAAPPAANADPDPNPDPNPNDPLANAEDDEDPAMHAEDDKPTDQEDPAAMTAKFTEALNKAVGPLQAKLAKLENQTKDAFALVATAKRDRDRAEIAAFCETHKGKIFPFELDPAVGVTVIDQALALSNDDVATFGEGATAKKIPPRQAFLNAIAARPDVARFAEKVSQPATPPQDDQFITALTKGKVWGDGAALRERLTKQSA